MEPAQVTSTLESLKFLQVAIAHEVDELNKIQRNLSSVEAAALVEWGKFLGGERESMLEDTHLITQEMQSIQRKASATVPIAIPSDSPCPIKTGAEEVAGGMLVQGVRPKSVSWSPGVIQASASRSLGLDQEQTDIHLAV